MRQPLVPLAPTDKAGRISRWRCRVPRCKAAGDGDVSDWRKHYVNTHMTR